MLPDITKNDLAFLMYSLPKGLKVTAVYQLIPTKAIFHKNIVLNRYRSNNKILNFNAIKIMFGFSFVARIPINSKQIYSSRTVKKRHFMMYMGILQGNHFFVTRNK